MCVSGGGELPALDACNGHYGTVPANATLGVEATCVYHYHLTEEVPYTIGCYGPVESVAACKALYTADASSDAAAGGMGGSCLDGFSDLLLADSLDAAAASVPVDLVCILSPTWHLLAAPACKTGLGHMNRYSSLACTCHLDGH